jgi:hypothetical protein
MSSRQKRTRSNSITGDDISHEKKQKEMLMDEDEETEIMVRKVKEIIPLRQEEYNDEAQEIDIFKLFDFDEDDSKKIKEDESEEIKKKKHEEAKTIVEEFSNAVYELSQNPNNPLCKSKLSDLYIKLITNENIKHDDYIKITDMISKKMKTKKERKVCIVMDKADNKDIKLFNKKCLMIGRNPYVDYIIDDSYRTISSLHAILLFFEDKTMVIDIGSLLGTKTLKRSSYEKHYSSEVLSRRVLIFEKNERFTLDMGCYEFDFTQL